MQRIIQPALFLLIALGLAACAAPQPPAEPGVTPPPMSRPLPPTPMPVEPAQPAPVAGVPDLDRSCRVDADCAVKDVGNCCGYFPACVNIEAQPDPAAVRAACAESGMASVCGFREIEACSCVANACQPAGSGEVL